MAVMIKFGILALSAFLVIMLMPAPAAAVWWNPVGWLCVFNPGDDTFLPGVLGPRTQQHCEYLDFQCDATGQYMCRCGDYDWDACLEWPLTVDQCEYCDGGCHVITSGPMCYSRAAITELCGDGGSCIEGQTRCGRTSVQGSPVDAVIGCAFDQISGCWVWSSTKVDACKYRCSESTGAAVCQDLDEWDASECSRNSKKCLGPDAYVRCIDLGGGMWKWDINNPVPCQYGCDNGHCLLPEGKEICHECMEMETQCYDDNTIQWCMPGNDGCLKWREPDFESRQFYTPCDFGCHLGMCNPDPITREILKEGDDCIFGKTRCVSGTHQQTCGLNNEGNPAWGGAAGGMKTCESGVCRSGRCLNKTQSGVKWQVNPSLLVNESDKNGCTVVKPWGLAFDDNRLWIYYEVKHTEGLAICDDTYGDAFILIIEPDGTFIRKINLTSSKLLLHSSLYGLEWDDYFNLMWTMNRTHMMTINEFGDIDTKWKIPVDYGDNDFFAVSDKHIYIGWQGNATYYYSKGSGTMQGYICNTNIMKSCGGGEHVSNKCRDRDVGLISDTMHTFMEFEKGILYQLFNTIDDYTITGDCPDKRISAQFTEPPNAYELQMYAFNGEFRGRLSVDPNKHYWGMGMDGDSNIIFMGEGTLTPTKGFLDTITMFIHQYFNYEGCNNPCFKDSQKCSGFLNDYYVDCVQDANGCWDWFSPEKFPELDANLYTHKCGAACEQYWENHKVRKARCTNAASCTDVCDDGETQCTDDGRAIMHCEYRSIPYYDPVNPKLNLINHFCWTWDLKKNWDVCPQGTECEDGHCVKFSQCSAGESQCYKGFSWDDEHWYVINCNDIRGDNIYEWNTLNRTRCQFWCNETSIDTTTGLPCNDTSTSCQRIAACTDIGAETWGDLQESGTEFRIWLDLMFKDPASRAFFMIVLMIITVATVGYLSGSWELGMISGTGWILIGSFAGWLPLEVMALMGVVVALMLYRIVVNE